MSKMSRVDTIETIKDVAAMVMGDVTSSYSGRGMYGMTCYGIKCYEHRACIEEAAAKGIRGAQVDQMGKRMIVYWPSIQGD